ncbi:MAG: transcription elongation factor GreA [Alphaproteobacteria bacterium]|nr:transcription elongation factor GreA [Alphaproteobacteria bacterium]
MNRLLVTEVGLNKLKTELINLRDTERPAVIKAIAEAAKHGDLSENAEYHAAREKQSFIEGRIAQLEESLQNAEVVDVKKFTGVQDVRFGAKVTLLDEETENQVVYKIVSPIEADPEDRLISQESPLARAILGRKKGDSVEVALPSEGVRYYCIESIEYK